jgi:hypothetical protein
MKKFSLYIVLSTLVLLIASCGPKRSQAFYAAPSQLLSSNYDGTYVIRTQVRARNAVIAFTDAQRKAVEEVIFTGVKSAADGLPDLKPLCFDMNAREKNEQYFRAFFQDNGPWTQYASLQDKRTGTTRYQRSGRQIVETVTVSVDRDALRDRLIADGIIPAGGRY